MMFRLRPGRTIGWDGRLRAPMRGLTTSDGNHPATRLVLLTPLFETIALYVADELGKAVGQIMAAEQVRSSGTDEVADDGRGVTISEASRVLGVPMPTLRSWELRYGMPGISHVRGRHRRYLPAEIHALRLMRDEVARGRPAGDAAATVRDVLGIGGRAGELIALLLADCERLDPAGVRSRLDEAAEALGLCGCVDDVLLPSMRQVGIWWEVGHCDVAQERMTTEAVRAWLDRRSAFAPAPTHRRPILLACGPRDLHTVGLESMAMVLRYEGWPCRVLGAHTSTVTVVTAAKATDAAAVVLVSHLATGRRQAVASIEALHQSGIKVFFAGNSFAVARNRAQLPGVYLGTRIEDARAAVLAALTDRVSSATG